MTADLLLSIDVGTQSVRALAFDRDGRMHGKAQVPFEPPFGFTSSRAGRRRTRRRTGRA